MAVERVSRSRVAAAIGTMALGPDEGARRGGRARAPARLRQVPGLASAAGSGPPPLPADSRCPSGIYPLRGIGAGASRKAPEIRDAAAETGGCSFEECRRGGSATPGDPLCDFG